jgi:hypothetical protein
LAFRDIDRGAWDEMFNPRESARSSTQDVRRLMPVLQEQRIMTIKGGQRIAAMLYRRRNRGPEVSINQK